MNLEKSLVVKIKNRIGFWAILWIFALILMIIRCFYSAEVTDESFYISEALLVAQGGTPYFDMWFQAPGFPVLLAPFIKLYILIFGNEGLFLFARLCSIFIQLLICFAISLLLEPIIGKSCSNIIGSFMFTSLPYSLIVLSYNSLYRLMIALASTCFFRSMVDYGTDGTKKAMAVLAGFIYAFAAYTYPSGTFLYLFNLVVIFVIYFLQNKNKYKKMGLPYYYIIGGLSLLIIILFEAFVIKKFTINQLIIGIHQILNEGYTKIEYLPIEGKIQQLKAIFSVQRLIFLLFLNIIIFTVNRCPIRFEKSIQKIKCIALLGIFAQFLRTVFVFSKRTFLCIGQGNYNSDVIGLLFLFPLFCFPFLKGKKQEAYRLLCFIWLPVLVGFILAGAFAFDGYTSRLYMLYFGSLLCIPFFMWAFECANFLNKNIILFLVACGMLFSCNITGYTYTYRDVPIRLSDTVINSGVYKGIHTSKHRKESILSLENKIKNSVSEDNSVVYFGKWNSVGYLMSLSRCCMFSTLPPIDPNYSMSGINRTYYYFSIKDEIPDKMVFFNEMDEPQINYSILENEKFPVNQFLSDNYHPVYENSANGFGFIVYERN